MKYKTKVELRHTDGEVVLIDISGPSAAKVAHVANTIKEYKMNVKELIEALSKCNPEAIVVCQDSEEGTIEIGFNIESSMRKSDDNLFYINPFGPRGIEEIPVVVLT